MSCDKPDLTDNGLFWMCSASNNNKDQKVLFGTEMNFDKQDLTVNGLFWMCFDNNNMDQKVFFGTGLNFDKPDLITAFF